MFLDLAIAVALLAVPAGAILDMARTSDAQWEAIGRSRLAWMVPVGAGTMFFLLPGVVVAGVYFASIRPKLQRSLDEDWR